MDAQLEIRTNEGRAALQLLAHGDEFTIRLSDDGLSAENQGWWNTEMEDHSN
jgi:hypothetical protein